MDADKKKEKYKEKRVKNTKPRYKEPNTFIYKFLLVIIKIWARILGIRADKESIAAMDEIEGPVLALGAHVSAIDFAGMILTLRKKKMAFLVAANMFFNKYNAKLFNFFANLIPKKQFSVDFESIKAMKFFIDNGVSIGLYPEGRVSIDGRPGVVSNSTVKLIKFLKVPVVFTYMPGGYLQRPRYVNKMRKGPILYSTARLLLTKEQVSAFSNPEIKAVLDEAFLYNEMQYQEEKQLSFVPRLKKVSLAQGVDTLLHQCPKCLAECVMEAKGAEMHCSICGNRVVIDSYGRITPFSEYDVAFSRIDKWYDFQRKTLEDIIVNNEDYTRKTTVTLILNEEERSGFQEIDRGELSLDKEGFIFKGQKCEMRFSIGNSPYISLRTGAYIDFYVDYKIYRCLFEVKGEPVQYNLAVELFYKYYHQQGN